MAANFPSHVVKCNTKCLVVNYCTRRSGNSLYRHASASKQGADPLWPRPFVMMTEGEFGKAIGRGQGREAGPTS